MKRKNAALIAITMVVIAVGSFCLGASVMQMKAVVQDQLSNNTEMDTSVGTKPVNAGTEQNAAAGKIDEVDASYTAREEKYIQDLYSKMTSLEEKVRLEQTAIEKQLKEEYYLLDRPNVSFVYNGQKVSIRDGLLTKAEAKENAMSIMDYIYSYVDETILTPNGIKKEDYSYTMLRQTKVAGEVMYSVVMQKEEDIICSIGIWMKEEPVMDSFSRDGLVDLRDGEDEIPEEYLVGNWCAATKQREAIYDAYFECSKELIEDTLGLPAILEEVKDVNSITYFDADNDCSTVTFGYVLENGLYVKVFYNRINQMWDGFAIAGYHEDYYTEAQ